MLVRGAAPSCKIKIVVDKVLDRWVGVRVDQLSSLSSSSSSLSDRISSSSSSSSPKLKAFFFTAMDLTSVSSGMSYGGTGVVSIVCNCTSGFVVVAEIMVMVVEIVVIVVVVLV